MKDDDDSARRYQTAYSHRNRFLVHLTSSEALRDRRQEPISETSSVGNFSRGGFRTRLCSSLNGRHGEYEHEKRHYCLNSFLIKPNVAVAQLHAFNRVPERVIIAPGNPLISQSMLKEMIENDCRIELKITRIQKRIEGEEISHLCRNAMRSILQGFQKWPACKPTRFLAVEYLSRFLASVDLDGEESNFKAATSACFRLACKIEEVHAVPNDIFEYTVDTMHAWEMALLNVLDWETNVPSIFTFCFLFYHTTNLTDNQALGYKVLSSALSLAEFCALDLTLYIYPASVRALCCFMLALKRNEIRDWFKAVDLLFDKENTTVTVKDCLARVSFLSDLCTFNIDQKYKASETLKLKNWQPSIVPR